METTGFDLNTRLCKKCRGRVETKTMKYDLNGKDLICNGCYEKQKGIRKTPDKAESMAPQGAAAAVHKSAAEERKNTDKFICNNCKYKFRGKPGSQKCPYCGNSSVEPFRILTADDLLNASIDSKYDC